MNIIDREENTIIHAKGLKYFKFYINTNKWNGSYNDIVSELCRNTEMSYPFVCWHLIISNSQYINRYYTSGN